MGRCRRPSKTLFSKLGIPEAEQNIWLDWGLSMISEMIYHNIHEELQKKGVVFVSIEDGLRQYPELF